ncbi:MAG TPA: hypothetical protein DCP92_08105 [Nitrospiraceae bacterium]|nr:hypothetical protein [Nitrospiraceae bacterium]
MEGRLNLHYDEAGKAVATEFKIRSAANRKSHEIAMKTSSGNTKGEVFLVTSHDNLLIGCIISDMKLFQLTRPGVNYFSLL